MGFGILPGMLLFVAGCHVWITPRFGFWRKAFLAGLCFGLAVATRWSFLPMLPGLIFFLLLSTPETRVQTLKLIIATGFVAGASFGLTLVLHLLAASESPAAALAHVKRSAYAAGISQDTRAGPRILSAAVQFGYFLPFPLLLGVIYLSWSPVLSLPDRIRQFLKIATICATIIALAWLLRSPFQHIRYVWPGVFLIFVAAGYLLAALYRHCMDGGFRWGAAIILMVTLGLAGQSYLGAARLAVMGAAMQINSVGMDNLENHFEPFRLAREQRDMVAYLRQNLSADDEVMALALPPEWADLPLALLSQRAVSRHKDWAERADGPEYVLTHHFASLNQQARAWLDANTTEVARIYGYSLHKADRDGLRLPAFDISIPNQGYRFALPRGASLTGP
jgi:hypothetical protein